MRILGGSAAGSMGRTIAGLLGVEYSAIELKKFPDGEFAAKVPFNAYGEDIIVVQSTYAPQDRHIMELLFIADALKEMKAKSIKAVIPYLAYMRQNKSFTEGESVNANVVMKMLSQSGIDAIITVQPHKAEPLSAFRGKAVAISPVRTLIKAAAKNLKDPYVLAPDKGGLELARSAAAILGCGYTHVDKERDPITGAAHIRNVPSERFEGKQVIIVDDVISTGGTIALSSHFAYSRGAESVVAAAVHLVMSDDAHHRMSEEGVRKIYGTNTIPCENADLVDISRDIAEGIPGL